MEQPDSGTIRFHDAVFNGAREAPLDVRRRVTTVFQQPMLLRRTVEANVAYGLRLRGQRNGSDQIRAALEEVGLGDLAKQQARTLSGGEAQRVALARAMILRPDALLLDEPTANLDPYNVGLIEQIVTRLNREQGTTIVLVTHNVFQAKRIWRSASPFCSTARSSRSPIPRRSSSRPEIRAPPPSCAGTWSTSGTSCTRSVTFREAAVASRNV